MLAEQTPLDINNIINPTDTNEGWLITYLITSDFSYVG